VKELIIEILEKLEKSNYIDPSEHLYDAIKEIKKHLNDNNLDYYIQDFLWGLENNTVLDVDGVIKECSDLLLNYKNNLVSINNLKK